MCVYTFIIIVLCIHTFEESPPPDKLFQSQTVVQCGYSACRFDSKRARKTLRNARYFSTLPTESTSRGMQKYDGMLAFFYSAYRLHFERHWKTWRNARQFSVTFCRIFGAFSFIFDPWGSIWINLSTLGTFACDFYLSGAAWNVKTSNWWHLPDLIWSPISVIYRKNACFFRDVFCVWFFYHFWVTKKVVRRVPARAGASVSLSHRSSQKR